MKKLNYTVVLAFIMLFTFNQSSFGQWTWVPGGNLQNDLNTNEIWFQTSFNTRARILNNGQWLTNPWSGAGGFISTPSGQADFANFKIRAGGTSGLVSYSFQNGDWGQNIQSYVGRALTVSYVVKWNGADRFFVAGQGWLFANGAWFGSDRSTKEEITPLKNSLDRVLKLNGYSFRFKTDPLCADCNDGATSNQTDGKLQIGLMADEVEQVVPEVVREVDVDKRKAIAYQNIVALLIESTKEQQKMINSLQAQVAKMMAFGGFNGQGQGNNGNGNGNNNPMDISKLFANSPNPFNSSTSIGYYLSANVTQADIKVWDMQGVERKNFSLNTIQGNGNVTLQASELPTTGTYICALIVDGQIIDSRTMVRN